MKSRFSFFLFFVIILACMSTDVHSVPAYPYMLDYIQPDGSTVTIQISGDERYHSVKTQDGYTLIGDENGFYMYAILSEDGNLVTSNIIAKNKENRTLQEELFLEGVSKDIRYLQVREHGQLRGGQNIERYSFKRAKISASNDTVEDNKFLVILVSFTDVAFYTDVAVFYEMLNQPGYDKDEATGSARDYFYDNSMGQFIPTFDVFGPVTLSREVSYYGGNLENSTSDIRPREMIIEACRLAQKNFGVDFSQYDLNKDSVVDHVCVVFSGYNEAQGGGANTIWPHEWNIDGLDNDFVLDGVRISSYSCSSELSGSSGFAHEQIGTFCHEFCHALGLPDLYDTDYEENEKGFDPGSYAIMASGAYNNGGRTPPYLSSFERGLLGWHSSTKLTEPAKIELPHFGESNVSFWFPTLNEDGSENLKEWFTLENRQQKGWDKDIPGHGLMICHVNRNDDAMHLWSSNKVNAYAQKQCYDIEEADDIQSEITRDNDLFPTKTGNKKVFRDISKPNSKSWAGIGTKKPITNITEDDGIVHAVFIEDPGSALPHFSTEDISYVVTSTGVMLRNLHPDSKICLYDLSGNLIHKGINTAETYFVELPHNSLYVLKVIANGNVSIGKILF